MDAASRSALHPRPSPDCSPQGICGPNPRQGSSGARRFCWREFSLRPQAGRQCPDVISVELGAQRGFDVIIIPPVIHKREVVSPAPSSAAKSLVRRRRSRRTFAWSSLRTHWQSRLRYWHGPPVHISHSESHREQELLPARGSLRDAHLLEGESRTRRSVTNVGVRPTFNGSALSVETHVLESLGETSPGRIEVHFWKRLREEKKFSGHEELRAQIVKTSPLGRSRSSLPAACASARVSV